MAKSPTVAAGNVYCKARLSAAKYNDRLNSRDGAAELLGVSTSTIASYELGTVKNMPVDVVVMMADLYRSKELLNHYCTEECPIGRQNVAKLEVAELDRITLKLLSGFSGTDDIKKQLIDIVADGIVTEDEKPALEEILNKLSTMATIIQELKLWVSNNME